MLRILFILFILVPMVEIYLLIEVGSGIGGLSTIALCILTATLGGFLIRYQGLSTLLDAQKRMAHGEIPADHGFHGLMIAFSGILLFLPGFISDASGFLLLFPPFRRWVISRAMPVQQINNPHQARQNRHANSDIIDVEVIEHDKHIP